MPQERISFRRCLGRDLLPAVRLILRTLNDFYRRTGMPPISRRPRQAPPMFLHLWQHDPRGFCCAWRGSRLVGFAGAITRGRHWYLAWLFVDPRQQDRGIGTELIRRLWRTGRGMVHGVSTFAGNMQPIGLYSRFGMLPIESLLLMRAPRTRLTISPPPGLELRHATRRDLAWINGLEKEIRGFPHAPEWRYWHDSEHYRILICRRRGRRIGYGMVSSSGEIAPIGVGRARDMLPVAKAVLAAAVQNPPGKPGQLQVTCPISLRPLYAYLLDCGFRNREMLVFMAEEAHADFQRYFPGNLALF